MRLIALSTLAVLSLAVAACSKDDQAKTGDDIKSAAGNLKDAVKEGASSEPAKELKSDVKDLAKDAGTAIKKGAGEIKEGAIDAKQAMDKTVAEQKAEEKK